MFIILLLFALTDYKIEGGGFNITNTSVEWLYHIPLCPMLA